MEEFDGIAYIQQDPDRLAIDREHDIIYVPWDRIVAFAVEKGPAPAGN